MATIGTFTKSGETFSGSVKTLSINAKTTIKAAEKGSEKAPDYRVFLRFDRIRGGLEEDLQRGPQLSLGQARRPELPGSDLRHPGRGRRRGQLQPCVEPSR